MNPNLFLVGTTKGGTSTLHLWLRQHPDVGLGARKELHFFCDCPAESGLRVPTSFEDYLRRLPTGKVVGEASPCYLYYPDTPGRIAGRFPESRILVSLRDPAERFWSHHLMNEIYRPSGLSADQIIDRCLERGPSNALEDLVGVGRYGEQVERYLRHFPRDRVKVVFLEDLARRPEATMAEILDFLALPPAPIDVTARDKEYVEPRGALGRLTLRNPTVRRLGAAALPGPVRRLLKLRVLGDPSRKPPLPPETRERLREIYRDDSLLLEDTLGRDLPWDWHRRAPDGRPGQD